MVEIPKFDVFGVEEMSAEEYKAKEAEVHGKCKCPGCPSYVEGDSPYGYCLPLIGTSKNIKFEKDCICETCPIYVENGLTHTHYCTRCSQVCQAYKSELGAGHE